MCWSGLDRKGSIPPCRFASGTAEELRDMAGSLLDGCGQIHCCSIGPVVGTHAGPGCAGFAFFVKE